MPIPNVTPPSDPPSFSDLANFGADANAFVGSLPTMVATLNAMVDALNQMGIGDLTPTSVGRSVLEAASAGAARTALGVAWERGSNANGEYVRFADGTQICTHRISPVAVNIASNGLFRSELISWTFPAAFVNGDTQGPMVTGRVFSDLGLTVSIPYGERLTSASNIRAWATSSVSATAVQLQAIGRWK